MQDNSPQLAGKGSKFKAKKKYEMSLNQYIFKGTFGLFWFGFFFWLSELYLF